MSSLALAFAAKLCSHLLPLPLLALHSGPFFIKEKLILISFFIHILQLLSYNGKNNVHNVDNFFNFVSFTYTQKNLTIFSLVILRNWSSEFSCLKKIRIMFHCAVSSRKNIEIFKICPNILGKSGWRKIKIRAPTTKLSLKIIDQILCQRYRPP